MFKCQSCQGQQPKGVKAQKVVTAKREKVYTRKGKDNKDEIIGRGWEIVKELSVCPTCASGLEVKAA